MLVTDNKRKMEDEDSQSIRSKRPAQKCSDLIVLGLPWKVEEKDLEAFFAPFGDLVMTMVRLIEISFTRALCLQS